MVYWVGIHIRCVCIDKIYMYEIKWINYIGKNNGNICKKHMKTN